MHIRDMTKIYARLLRVCSAQGKICIFSHIPSNHVIIGIFHTPVDETIIDSNLLYNETESKSVEICDGSRHFVLFSGATPIYS